MRTLPSLLALVSLATTTLLARPADACGSYMPELQVFRVTSHYVKDGTRSFALTGMDATDAKFRQLLPMSYDNTKIADLPALARPVTLTLVGEAGTREVTSRKQLLIKDSWHVAYGTQMKALEVPSDERFQIAVGGKHFGLAWTDLSSSAGVTSEESAWLVEHGVVASGVIHKQPIAGTETVAFVAYDAKAARYLTTLRNAETALGAYYGMPLGVLTADGMDHLVLDDNGVIRTHEVY